MAMIHVSRSGATLGVFDEARVRAGLTTGEFIATDLGWTEGMATWLPLSELDHFGVQTPPTPIAPAVVTEPLVAMPEATMPAGLRLGLPWDRAEGVDFNALIETIKVVLMRPTEAFDMMKREGGLGRPLLYVLILGVLGAALSFGFSALLASFKGLGDGGGLAALAGSGITSVFVLVLMPVFIIVGTFLGAAILHICLMITGGAKQSFETTLRVVCYASGSANVIAIVPICGGIIAGLYSIVLNCIGLTRAHETDSWRAVVAVLLPVLVCCGSGIFFVFVLIGAMAGSWH